MSASGQKRTLDNQAREADFGSGEFHGRSKRSSPQRVSYAAFTP